MTAESINIPRAINVDDKWLYKAGGIAAVLTGLLYLIALVLLIYAGKLPSTGVAWLSFVNGKSGVWSAVIAVTFASDILFMLVNVTLYLALRQIHRGLALIATVWGFVANVLIEATINANYGSMLTLGGHYATAGSVSERAANVAAADYANSVLSSWLNELYSLAMPSVAIVIISVLMLRSPFGKRIAYLGIAAGTFGLISLSGFGLAIVLEAVLEAVWLILVGRCLYIRYAAPAPVAPAESPQETVGVTPRSS